MLSLNFSQRLVLIRQSFQHHLLLVDLGLELLLLLAAVVLFALDLVASTNGLQLRLFDFSCLQLEDFVQRGHIIIKLENLCIRQSLRALTLEEIDALRFQILGLAVFFRRQHANLVVLVEGDVYVDFAVH